MTALWRDFVAFVRRMPQATVSFLKGTSRTTRWIAGVILMLIVALLVFLAQPNWNWARPMVASVVSGKTHRPVAIEGNLRVHLFSHTPSAELNGLRIGQPAQGVKGVPKGDLANIARISIRTELAPLFIGRLVLPRLDVQGPVLVLYQDADGHANWDFNNGADKGKPLKLPLIKNFIINDGKLSMTSVQRRLTFTGTINAHERAGTGGEAFRMTGEGKLNNKPFDLEASGGPLLNVRTNVPYPFKMKVSAGATRITADGRVLHPFNLGQVEAALTLNGNNLADLYYLTGLTLPNTPAYRLSAQVGRDDRVYKIDKINGKVGGSDLSGALKVDTRNKGRPYLTGDLSSRLLDFKDLGALFGASAANAPEKPKLAVDPDATAAVRRLLPDATLDIERVRGMDAKVHYRALAVQTLSNLPLRKVSLGVNLDHGLLTLDPIEFDFPHGQVTGTARMDARASVQHNAIDMRLAGLHVQDFLPEVGGSVPLEGVLNARLRATGTGNSVHKAAASADGELSLVMPNGTIRQSLAELMGIDATKGLFLLLTKNNHQTQVRCAIAGFNIQNGVMRARNVVFDTDVVRLNGSGSINLNDEGMKLVFKGKPKKFRLIRINAPIVIGGHLSAPKFGIQPAGAIVQGGLAAAFGTILPFVNFDYAKDANCSGLIAEAQAQGTPKP
ncbi:MAG: AsmA family protein [Asticcacaulis sp.]